MPRGRLALVLAHRARGPLDCLLMRCLADRRYSLRQWADLDERRSKALAKPRVERLEATAAHNGWAVISNRNTTKVGSESRPGAGPRIRTLLSMDQDTWAADLVWRALCAASHATLYALLHPVRQQPDSELASGMAKVGTRSLDVNFYGAAALFGFLRLTDAFGERFGWVDDAWRQDAMSVGRACSISLPVLHGKIRGCPGTDHAVMRETKFARKIGP